MSTKKFQEFMQEMLRYAWYRVDENFSEITIEEIIPSSTNQGFLIKTSSGEFFQVVVLSTPARQEQISELEN